MHEAELVSVLLTLLLTGHSCIDPVDSLSATPNHSDDKISNKNAQLELVEHDKIVDAITTGEDDAHDIQLGHFDGCGNHGNCYRQGTDFYCCCQPGYTGRQCEVEIIYTPTPTAKITPRKTAMPKSTPTNTRPTCVPVNTCSAHFTCNSNGSMECLTGWSGGNCDQLIPDSEADCTVYDYENDFITSEWNGTFKCDNNTRTQYMLNISKSDADYASVGTLTIGHVSLAMTVTYASFAKIFILESQHSVTEQINGFNFTRAAVNMKLNSSLYMTGAVLFYGDTEPLNCKSEFHRISAYFDGCKSHGDCFRYGRNKNDFKCCCHPGFSGRNCEEILPSTPATNHAHCQPVNNCSAHYTCNPDGSKTCLDGWTGTNCDQIIPDSVADCSFYDFVGHTVPVSTRNTTGVKFAKIFDGQTTETPNDTSCSDPDIKPHATITFTVKNGVKEANVSCINDAGKIEEDYMLCKNGTWTIFKPPQCVIHFALITEVMPILPTQPFNLQSSGTLPSPGKTTIFSTLLCELPEYFVHGSFKVDGPIANFSCDADYNLLGNSTIACVNSSWNDTLPICSVALITEVMPILPTQPFNLQSSGTLPSPGKTTIFSTLLCELPEYFVHGSFKVDGPIANFSCDADYNLLGNSTIACVNSSWNDTLPICSECSVLKKLVNGETHYLSEQTVDAAVHTCYDGYVLYGASITYCFNGVWSNATLPSCVLSASSCRVLNDIENGLVRVLGLSNGSLAVYNCSVGYNIVGVAVRICLNGTWSDTEPSCRITDCGALDSIDNGEVVTLGGTTFGALAVYSCDTGYFVNGSRSRVCLANGTWSNRAPSCRLIRRHLAVYSCDTGYFVNGSRSRVCLANGTWSNRAPSCRLINCGNLTSPENGAVHFESQGENRTLYGSIASYSCASGYFLVGFTSRVCLSSSKWSGESPECIEFTATVEPCPRSTDNWDRVWQEAQPGQTVTKRCEGQNFLGEISRYCSMQGEWALPVYNCIRREISNVQQQVEELHTNPTSAGVSQTLDQLAEVTTTDNGNELHAGELDSVTQSLQTIAAISETSLLVTQEQSQTFIETASNVLDQRNAESWQALSQSEDETGASRVLQSIDKLSEAIFRSLENGNASEISVFQPNIVMEVKRVPPDQSRIAFPDRSSKPGGMDKSETGFTLPLNSATGPTIRSYTGVFYKNLTSVFPDKKSPSYNNRNRSSIYSNGFDSNDTQLDTDKTLNTPVLSLQLYPSQRNLSQPLVLTFQHQRPNFRNASCSYWCFNSDQWETDGCHMKTSTESITVCECYHLTNFAVLMSPWNKDSETSTVIEVISIVGCSVSILCLLITLFTHLLVWRYMKSDRVVILMNLCIALTVSYIIFLAGVNQTQNRDACIAVAALLQYIYLVVFFLMLAEGIEIAVTVLYVFSTKSRIKWLLPAAWGIPAVIVGISLGVTKLEGYGTDNFCWLSVESGLIWAFVGPALVIILVNVIFLILVLRAMLSTKAVSEKSDKEKITCSLRCLCVLLPLMGCTWVLGIFYVNERMVWVQYVFAICNSLQGFFIFLFHGFLNKQLRTAIQRRHKKYKDSVTTSKVLSSKPREPKRDKPLTNGAAQSEPVHLVSYEKRRSWQSRRIKLSV